MTGINYGSKQYGTTKAIKSAKVPGKVGKPQRILKSSNNIDIKPQRLKPPTKSIYKAHRVSNVPKTNENISVQPKRITKVNDTNSLSRREQLEKWRAEKGLTRKENCHPLLSRKRALSKVVASPSYKPISKHKPKQNNSRRHTMAPHPKKPELNLTRKERRQTMPNTMAEFKFTPTHQKNTKIHKNTPWANKTLNMLERLDLWLEAKGKTPHVTPHTKKTKRYINSPFPTRVNSNEREASLPSPPRLCSSPDVTESKSTSTPEVDLNATFTLESKLDVKDVQQQLEHLLRNKEINKEEIQTSLDDLIHKFPEVVQQADYWICRARLVENDVQRVICLLEQAYTFNAKPEEKIKKEICLFLEKIESEDKGDDVFEDYLTKYAITPGRKVHFAADTTSPVQFKSSIIKFCIVESKTFKKRLNAQINRKIMTPVRRSARFRKSDLPSYLKSFQHFVESPSEVENDILEGKIHFVPNKTINTPLNNGWMIKDEFEADLQMEEDTDLSFM